jgi:genome maintenance exonuclease 1
LYSDTLQLAGTVDCLAEYENELSVIDFKTSTKYKEKEYIESYFVQATCYSIMIEELFGIKAKQLVILFQTDDGESFVHKSKRSEWYETLLRMRKIYKDKMGC